MFNYNKSLEILSSRSQSITLKNEKWGGGSFNADPTH